MRVAPPKQEPADRPRRRGWSVRPYMVLSMVVLLAVASLSAVAVRTIGQQDARQSATADASFAARAGAAQIAGDLLLLQQTTARLASNPQVAALLASPSGGPCALTFAGGSPFSSGHLDIIKSDGSVKCSSRAIGSGPAYAAAGRVPAAINGPVVVAPYAAPRTSPGSAGGR